ncbi:hypothetical protein [Sporosarcina cascadiensis]|uniref:hypothetical protein n=1 Tax=Sporosarcina cascadiensis TaxID=2660747 RepID=UPI00129A59F7|nr:hypothetical protein [Sporosarcina cascadiensis]
MRKIILLFCLSSVLALGACAASDKNKLTIPELTDREEQIIQTAADQVFIFDYATDQTYSGISLWMDKYEKGEKIGGPIGELSIPLPGESTNGTLIMAIKPSDDKLLFSASISGAGLTSEDQLPDIEDMATLTAVNPQEGLPLSENMLLSAVAYTNSSVGVKVSSFSVDFFEQNEGYLEELKEYDVAYLVRASFKK